MMKGWYPIVLIVLALLIVGATVGSFVRLHNSVDVSVKSVSVDSGGVLSVTYFVRNGLGVPLDGYRVQAYVPCFERADFPNVEVVAPHSTGRLFHFELRPTRADVVCNVDGLLAITDASGNTVYGKDLIRVKS